MMTNIYANPNQTVMGFVNLHERFYLVQLIGGVSRTHYKGVFRIILQNLEKEPFNKLLFNVRDMTTNPDMGRRWFTIHFLRHYYKQVGMIQLAVINPQNAIERKGITFLSKLISKFGIKVQIQFFDDVLAAQEWLTQTPSTIQQKSFFFPEKQDKPNWFTRIWHTLRGDKEGDDSDDLDDFSPDEFYSDENPKPKKILAWKKSRFKVKVLFDKNGKLKE